MYRASSIRQEIQQPPGHEVVRYDEAHRGPPQHPQKLPALLIIPTRVQESQERPVGRGLVLPYRVPCQNPCPCSDPHGTPNQKEDWCGIYHDEWTHGPEWYGYTSATTARLLSILVIRRRSSARRGANVRGCCAAKRQHCPHGPFCPRSTNAMAEVFSAVCESI